MNWLSFFIGVLVGWILEWVIDVYYWRSRWQSSRRDNESLRARLDQAQIEIRTLERELAAERLRPAGPQLGVEAPAGARALELTADAVAVPDGEVKLEGEPAPAAAVPAGAAVAAGGVARPEPAGPNDLVVIEGIGPKIAQVLNDAGIVSYAQLAAASPEQLGDILQQAGPRYRLADPASWPEQARLAAAGSWDELKALQQRLTSGRRAAPNV